MRALLIIFFFFNAVLADHDDEIDLFEFHMLHDMEYINLSKEQKDKIFEILLINNRKLKILHEKKELVEDQMRKIFLEEKFDREKFISMLMELKKESVKIESELLQKIHKVLTPKQRKLFINHIEEWEIE